MPRVRVLDRKGNELELQYLDNFFFPLFPFQEDTRKHLQDVRNLHVRDDDVLMWSYAKTGNHWLWEMIQMVQRGNTEYDKHTKEDHTIDFMTPAMLEAMPSPRTLNCHFLFEHLPKGFFEKEHKVIVMHRDPRDVAVSWYHHILGTHNFTIYTGDFDDYLELFVEGTVTYGSYFDFTRNILDTLQSNPQIPVLHVFYEDMIADAAHELRRVADFLGMPTSDQLCQAVAQACEFQRLKQAISSRPDPLRAGWRDEFHMCRKGVVGDWKNFFSEEDKEYFDRVFRQKLAGTFFAERYLQ